MDMQVGNRTISRVEAVKAIASDFTERRRRPSWAHPVGQSLRTGAHFRYHDGDTVYPRGSAGLCR